MYTVLGVSNEAGFKLSIFNDGAAVATSAVANNSTLLSLPI